MIWIAAVLPLITGSGALQKQTAVSAWVTRDAAPGKNVQLTLNTQNVPVVSVTAYPVDGLAWLSKERRPGEYPKPIGPPQTGWSVTVAQRGQVVNPLNNYFSRQVNLPISKPGVYLLKVYGGMKSAYAVVNVTNLAVVMKRSPYHALAWVTDHKTGRVVARASVRYFTRDGHSVESVKTGRDGVALCKLPLSADRAVVQRDKDIAGVIARGFNPDGRLQALFQTDRPIYRPGQTVFFKAILRLTSGQGYEAAHSQDVVVRLRDPKDNPLDEQHLATSPVGSVEGSFRLPVEGMLGGYTLGLQLGKQTALQTVSVEEYRKPEYKVEVTPLAKRYLSGENARFEVNAAYYFGAPVPQAQVRWTARRNDLQFWNPDPQDRWFYGGDGNLYPRDTYATQPFVAEGNAFTAADGKVVIDLHTDPRAPDSSYSVSVTVVDSSRRQVEGSSSVPVYAATIRLGLTTDRETVPLGGLVPVKIQVRDIDGNPASAKVTLVDTYSTWDEKKGRWIVHELARTHVDVPSSGNGVANLPATAAGTINIEATASDPHGRTVHANLSVYVADPNYKPEKEDVAPEVTVRLDKRTYRPGETVHAYVESNRRGIPILVNFEGRDIFDYRVLPGSGAYSFKTSALHSPNSFVDATQWFKSQRLNSQAIVPVPDITKLIVVKAIPDKKEYRPGDKATFTVRTTDTSGKPVAAEVAIAVVDEAIYALSPDNTPDPFGFYWGRRNNWTSTFQSAPEEVEGGAYQRANSTAPVRQRFEDTAYWKALVTTGPDGLGKVQFEMPGNLTTWRATTRAVTTSTRVGEGRSSVVATRPLTLRLATPRQMSQGDRLVLFSTVNNRTAKAVPVDVTLEVAAVTLEGPSSQHVDVPAHGEARIAWPLRSDQAGTASLLGSAAVPGGGDLSDALKLSLNVTPRGVRQQTSVGGIVQQTAGGSFDLPADTLSQTAYVNVKLSLGLGPTMRGAASDVLRSGRYASVAAANILEVSNIPGLPGIQDQIRESLALISRTQTPSGWGWWESTPPEAPITAKVVSALALARDSGVRVFDRLMQSGLFAAQYQYEQSQLWEHRALLASALTMGGSDQGLKFIEEVRERGLHLSPFARLRLAEALVHAGHSDAATHVLDPVLPLVSAGNDASYLPVGFGIGWTADDTQTTAELLTVLNQLHRDPELQTKLARWLTSASESNYRSPDDNAALARALHAYLGSHPESGSVGIASLTLNGQKFRLTASSVEPSSSAELFNAPIKAGGNEFKLERDGAGEALYELTVRYYRDDLLETMHGVRVSRRFEVRNEAGVWTELNRIVKPGEPVRITVMLWGDDISDAVRVTEPIPAGFEYVESEYEDFAREEVRDGALVHYLLNAGRPTTFRYYLRAESDGKLLALPAIAEYLRRPATTGHSAAEPVEVKGD